MTLLFRNKYALVTSFLFLALNVSVADTAKKNAAYAFENSANWTFSGLAKNEDKNEYYYYYFQLQKEGDRCRVKTVLLNNADKATMYYQSSQSCFLSNEETNLQIGKAFLQFNPITSAWVFGLKKSTNQGFNFKVDLLKQSEKADSKREIAKGLCAQFLNPKRMNGHIHWGEGMEETFVTSNVNTFRLVSKNEAVALSSGFNGVFCFLEDNNRFYGFQLPSKDATSATLTQWRTPQGELRPVSQFIETKTLGTNKSCIALKIPKWNLQFENTLPVSLSENGLEAGAAHDTAHGKGVCFLDNLIFTG